MLLLIRNKAESVIASFSFVRFCIVGIANTALGISCIFIALYFFKMNIVSANLAGYLAGFILSYFLNKNWTFHEKENGKSSDKTGKSFFLFGAVTIVAYGANLTVLLFLNVQMELNVYLSQIIAISVYTFVSFAGSRFVAFRPPLPSH